MDNSNPDELVKSVEKNYDATICYYNGSGSRTYGILKEELKDFEIREFNVSVDSQLDDKAILGQFVESSLLIVLLTKDTLKQHTIVRSLELAGLCPSVKVVLVHDPDTCFFPGPSEQPEKIRHHFSEKAITFLADYSPRAADQIRDRLKQKRQEGNIIQATSPSDVKEEIATRAFLSHRRLTAQGIAGRIYEGLKRDYRIFLDSEAQFKIHDLEEIVKNTSIFVCILSAGYFESEWCVKELKTAIEANKKILVIRDYIFQMPDHITALTEPEAKKLLESKRLTYMAEYYNDCLTKIIDYFGVPDKDLAFINEWLKLNPSEAIKIENKDSYSLNLSNVHAQFDISTFLRGLAVNFEFPLQQLQVLDLHNTKLDDNGTSWFKNLPKLINLNIAGTKITSVGLKTILAYCPFIEILDVSKCPIDGVALKEIENKLKMLYNINLTYCNQISDDELQAFINRFPSVKVRC